MYHGEVQRGLPKTIAIGLGKLDGARFYDRASEKYSFAEIVRGRPMPSR
jgi:hypothetical protein